MKKVLFFSIIWVCLLSTVFGQSNILVTNPVADQVLHGTYNPAAFQASTVINHPAQILPDFNAAVSPDSLLAYLEILQSFKTRNTGSDTVSTTEGMGAARRWAYRKMQQFSAQNENRLLPSYLQFDLSTCGMDQHRNVLGILPGMDSTLPIIIVEAHLDSRCDNGCDVNCVAYGADDNGSGSAMVLELARVLSKFSFHHTIVFMLTTGEEQGLLGADAMADYCFFDQIPIKAVQNNDVVGGIYCGQTASFPGCPGAGDVDSLNLRMYSFGTYNSPHKSFARWLKLEYQEELLPLSDVPMTLHVMTQEDRSGRGGDHIPFRQKAYTAMRFTCANEHGNGAPNAGYTDRQHTSSDSLGIDLNNDGTIDSFYVDFNYLARNTRINANGLALMGIGPETPDFNFTPVAGGIAFEITNPTTYPGFRVGIRTSTQDWDSVYTLSGTMDTVWGLDPAVSYVFQVASMDTNGVESLFSNENFTAPLNRDGVAVKQGIQLLQNHPNPFDEVTAIGVRVDGNVQYETAYIKVADLNGREIQRIEIRLDQDLNEVLFEHGFQAQGTYLYSLVVDVVVIDTKRMVFNY